MSVDWSGVGEALVRASRNARRIVRQARCISLFVFVLMVQWPGKSRWMRSKKSDIRRARCCPTVGQYLPFISLLCEAQRLP